MLILKYGPYTITVKMSKILSQLRRGVQQSRQSRYVHYPPHESL